MTNFPNTSFPEDSIFRFENINPSLLVDPENLLTLQYPEEQALFKEMEQIRNINAIRPAYQTLLNSTRNKINSEDDFYNDYNTRFEKYISNLSQPSYFSTDFAQTETESYRQMIKQHSDFMATELTDDPQMVRDWEARQQIMLEGNLNNSVLTVALMADDVTTVSPKNIGTISFFNDLTFTRGSLWGKVQDPTASSPQVNELIGENAQTLRYMALRWRGGKSGKLWNEANANSQYLRDMFVEDPTTKSFLDTWTNVSPTLFSLTASTSFAWAGKTIFDILAEAPVPENWDPKVAVQEIKEKTPKLAYVLFNQIGLTEEQLTNPEVAKNPQMFKYFIADAIDNHAASVIQQTFNQNSNGFTNFTFDIALPVLRDSLNSNDTMAELGLTAVGLVATGIGALAVPATGGTSTVVAAGGVAATTTGVASFLARAGRGIRVASRLRAVVAASPRFASSLRTGARALERLPRVSNLGLKTLVATSKVASQVYRFAPHNIGESLLSLTKGTKIGDTLFWVDDAAEISWKNAYKASKKQLVKQLGKHSLKSLVNGAGQGAVEDTLRQYQTQSAGFQSEFSWESLGMNMVEEGVGEIVIGGVLNFGGNVRNAISLASGKRIEFLDKLDQSLLSKFGKTKEQAVKLYNKLSPEVRRRIEISLATMGNLDEKAFAGMSMTEQVDFKVAAINLNYRMEALGETTGLGNFVFNQNPNSFVENLLVGLANGDKDAVTSEMRMQLVQTLLGIHERTKDPSTNQSTLGSLDWRILAFASLRDRVVFNPGMTEDVKESIIKRLNQTLFNDTLTEVFPDLKNADGKPATFATVPADKHEEVSKQLGEKLQERENAIKTQLFGSSTADDVNKVHGVFIAPEDMAFLETLGKQYATQNNVSQVKVTGSGVGMNGLRVSATPSPTVPSSPAATPSPTVSSSPTATPTLSTNQQEGFDFVADALKQNLTLDELDQSPKIWDFSSEQLNKLYFIFNEAKRLGITNLNTATFLGLLQQANQQRSTTTIPTAPQAAPTAPQAAPTAPQAAPTAPEPTVAPEATPVAPEPTVAPEATPVAPEPTVAPEAAPEITNIAEEMKDTAAKREDLATRRALEAGIKVDIKPEEEDPDVGDFMSSLGCKI